MTDDNLHPVFRSIIEAHTGGPNMREQLTLAGYSTDQIWIMEDGPESHPIGIRLDCGDSGVVHLSKSQGRELAAQLLKSCGE